jgi:hypothetical protein
MKRFTLCCICILGSFAAWSQHNSLGIRLGDPTGITFKRYLPANKAVEFLIGTAPRGFSETYYKKTFRKKYDDLHYIDHRASDIFCFGGRYLFHHQIPTEGLEGKVDWYWGAGASFRTAKVEYIYEDLLISANETFYKSRTDIDFGPEVMGGVELTLQNIPLSIFGEMSMMFEIVDRITIRVPGGIGVRYNF